MMHIRSFYVLGEPHTIYEIHHVDNHFFDLITFHLIRSDHQWNAVN